MLRIIRIMLLTMVPMIALGTFAAGCGDDTSTPTTTHDMAVTTGHDMATGGGAHDMASHD